MSGALAAEIKDQGHTLTGNLERSITATFTEDGVQGFMLDYQKYVDNGFPASSANWGQFPYVFRYFLARGYVEADAKRFAAATIVKWMKEGMPTKDSALYSNNGFRTDFVNRADRIATPEIDSIISGGIDRQITREHFSQLTETI